MKTNTGITIYHKKYDKKNHLDRWDIQHIENVMWQGGKGASLNKGYDQANDINIWIPYNKNQSLKDIPISIGDIVVKGLINKKIEKESDLVKNYYVITTIIDNDYASFNMQHLFIGAK